jgi:cobalt-precorrin-7 (C5)-methyltransferase
VQKKLFIVGVGPGNEKYITQIAKEKIQLSKYIVGYKYTLNTIEKLIDKEKQIIHTITMKNQERVYSQVYESMQSNDYCVIPFTDDANFSESEVIDRLLEIFGDENVEIIPGKSSIQVAAAKSKVPLDKSTIVSFHVTGDIEQKKIELLESVQNKKKSFYCPDRGQMICQRILCHQI